ncbi:MAG: hypothetical protein ACYCWW_10610 [Deltaproteobacteria bacterium]
MRKTLLVVPLLLAGCLNQGNESIDLPFAVLATDELQAPSPGTPCFWSPLTQAGGFFRSDGFVELDPAINPSPEYKLGLQVENDLDNTVIVDSNGNPISGPQRNEFHVQSAQIKYIPQQDYLSGNGMPNGANILATGDFAPIGAAGGSQGAGVMLVQTLTTDAVKALQANIGSSTGHTSGDLVMQIQLNGVLGSGEAVSSGTFFFPLHVCFDCFGTGASCPTGSVAVVQGHGACCSNQDFSAACVACGAKGEPCCPGATLATQCPFEQSTGTGSSAQGCQVQTTPPIGTEFCPTYIAGPTSPEVNFEQLCQ